MSKVPVNMLECWSGHVYFTSVLCFVWENISEYFEGFIDKEVAQDIVENAHSCLKRQ